MEMEIDGNILTVNKGGHIQRIRTLFEW